MDSRKKIINTLPGFWTTFIAFIFALIVLGLGAYTRLVHAGLGCPDWPGCYGFMSVPETHSMIHMATIRFPEAPVDPTKGWPEMIHRYAAGTLVLLVVLINCINIRYRKNKGQPLKLGLCILGIIFLQAAFGMWTVTLKLWPQVVTAHLLGGFITLTLIFVMLLRLSGLRWPSIAHIPALKRTRVLAAISTIVIFFQITLGGWLSANYAALACPDFPECQGNWWPKMDFLNGFNFMQSIGPDYLGGVMNNAARTAIHFTHRAGAFVVTILLLTLCWSLIKDVCKSEIREKGALSGFIWLILVILTLQIILGISNVVFYMPLSIAILHNLGGALFLLALVALNYRLLLKS